MPEPLKAVGVARSLANRLFQKRRQPTVKATNCAAITSALEAGTSVGFVNSYPRSGNTWMRYLLSDVFLQLKGVVTSTDLPVSPDRIIPDLYWNRIEDRDPGVPTAPSVFVKTHESFGELQSLLDGRDLGSCAFLYIFRSPEDALVSHYHFNLRDARGERKVTDGIDGFCLRKLSVWEENLSSHIRAREAGHRVFLAAYESMLEDTPTILGAVLRWLGVRDDDALVQRAVANMKFENLRAREVRTSGEKKKEYFFRRGIKGSGREELKAETVSAIRERAAGLLDEAAAIAAEDRRGTLIEARA